MRYINTDVLTSNEKDELIKFLTLQLEQRDEIVENLTIQLKRQKALTYKCTDFMAKLADCITDFVIEG